MRKIVLFAVLASFAGMPALKALATESPSDGQFARTPAATDSTTQHKKKKKKKAKSKKKKKATKKHATSKKSGEAATNHKKAHTAKGKTHAPKAEPMPSAPQYPTQPGAAGGFSDIPNEKKDDLPPPAPQPN